MADQPAAPARAGYLRLAGLTKVFPGKGGPQGAAVAGIDLEVAHGELLAVLGPSGCGKSTTLRMIAGLIEPSAGTVEVGGRDITRLPVHRRDMGVVFQSYALFPHLDVFRNVAFGLEMRKTAKSEVRTRVARALDLVRLGHLGDRRVSQLSGGQQQRVALARALVIEPAVLLLDEPLSNLDAQLRGAMRDEIRRIHDETGITTVFVTHDQREALSMADRVAVMNAGRVEQLGTPEEVYERPSGRFTAEFVGRANLLPGTVTATHGAGGGAGAEVAIPGLGMVRATGDAVTPDGRATVMLRPHRITLRAAGKADAGPRGTVLSAGYSGEVIGYRVRAAHDGPELEVEHPAGAGTAFGPGAEVLIGWDDAAPRLVADDGDPA
ncbi:ABC transporter ATP-binding protein [Streptomyces sp. XM4011]|uniref:ABC transporter ATP-binding protein n=1 Tax=Streptomyces sp. XM4011 TaxID=2929780 RepID=UPI001FFBCAFF|nr:ABC transporter ATP-binding protein [Streptomyces sp. XM4011]MCK1817818.1 ABC transporter ATP-binding protein [Streptomyces sp. XM4011]